jgi:hypothetical protein
LACKEPVQAMHAAMQICMGERGINEATQAPKFWIEQLPIWATIGTVPAGHSRPDFGLQNRELNKGRVCVTRVPDPANR